jgi:diphosphomevalonate decarboxylase
MEMKTIASVTWKSPSNIAIIKYWGKKKNQIPENPSFSFTLSECYTETTVSLVPKESKSQELQLQFYFDKKENIAFRLKLLTFFASIQNDFKFLQEYGLVIHSTNSFPHSSGIASSASSYSALAAALCDLSVQLKTKKKTTEKQLLSDEKWLKKTSLYARLGSGSACRSLFPYASIWGESEEIAGSSNEYGICMKHIIHKEFKTIRDTILITSSNEKKVSSRIGHSLMRSNPFAKARYKQAHQNLKNLLPAIKSGDWETFGNIAENEAMTLHALMMCSNPSFILMNAHTLSMIESIRSFRENSKIPLYFTLDAGPNVHLLYPAAYQKKVLEFADYELSGLCEDGKMIHDFAGTGPKKVK